MLNEIQNITAKSWILMDSITNEYWRGNNTMQRLQFASLGKMYTLTSCLDINQLLNIKPQKCWIQIISSIDIGTQADLYVGKYLTLQEVYYGMMLPSGNDAAMNLAYYYGYLLGKKNRFPEYEWTGFKYLSLQGKRKYNRVYLTRFIHYMNQTLVKQKLWHRDTHFQNPHGLPDKMQRSTALELCQAAMQFLKNQKFCKIVQTANFTARYYDGESSQWENTNVLLKQGYIGVKTGYTYPAGNCLCSRKIIYHNLVKYDLILVVLGCKTQEARFTQTVAIIQDFIRYLRIMKK